MYPDFSAMQSAITDFLTPIRLWTIVGTASATALYLTVEEAYHRKRLLDDANFLYDHFLTDKKTNIFGVYRFFEEYNKTINKGDDHAT